MAVGIIGEAAIKAGLGAAVNGLVAAISEVIDKTKEFKPLLNRLNETVDLLTPRIQEINRSKKSREIKLLIEQLNQAKETVDKCSSVPWWNLYMMYKLSNQLSNRNDSICKTLQVHFPAMILEDTTRILRTVNRMYYFNVIIIGIALIIGARYVLF